MSHPVSTQSYYCEDCFELFTDEPHKCIHLTGNKYE